MDEDLSKLDSSLLARLNALKQSNVAFNHPINPSSITAASSRTNGSPEDLIARFQKLYGREAAEIQVDVCTESAIDPDDRRASPTVEELLAELGPEEQYTIHDKDLVEANQLLAEARDALPKDVQWKEPELENAAKEEVKSLGRCETSSHGKIDEEAEAEISLQRILDEVELEKQQEPAAAATIPSHNTFPHSLPSVPKNSLASPAFPSPAAISTPPSFILPSTPTAAPSTRKPKPNPSGFSNEEIDSWCVICCANATVKCFGCDGDLYCLGCWREGHTGEDVGLEEKTHVWERITRTGNKNA
jgi:hypothetical protein